MIDPAGDAGPARLAVVHGPGPDLGRRGLETPAPGSAEALEALLAGWAAEVASEADAVVATGERDVLAAARRAAEAITGGHADGLVLVAGGLAFDSTDLAAVTREAVAAGAGVVDLHLGDLRRAGLDPADSLLAAAGARTIHGRGIEGYRWALGYLAARHAWPAVTTRAYGPGPDQVGDLRVPPGPGPHPVAVLLHGGFWLDPWQRDLLEGVAADLVRRGWATWNVEYRRTGGGGGWPATFTDVAAAFAHVEALAAEHDLDAGAVLLVGHSAGAHLGLRLAADLGARAVEGVVALAPIADLAGARAQGLGGGAVDRFLGGAPLGDAAPLTHLPLGVPQLVVHCADDALVPIGQSERWTEVARSAGDPVTLLTLPSGGHFAPVSPTGRAWQATAALLEATR
jgi:acetyl esterase/lipase